MSTGPFVRAMQGVATAAGVLLPPERAIIAGTGLEAADDPSVTLTGNGQSIIGATRLSVNASAMVTPAAVLAAIAGQAIAPASVAMGPSTSAFGTATTTGSGPAPLISFPLADNSSGVVELTVVGLDAAHPGVWRAAGLPVFVDVVSGVLVNAVEGPALFSQQTFELPPAPLVYSWDAGALLVTAHGPIANIASTADSGGTATLVTVTESLMDSGNPILVTIAGTVNTTGLNGAQTGTYVSEHVFSVPVVWGSSDTTGTVVFTVPPSIALSAVGRIVVAPAP